MKRICFSIQKTTRISYQPLHPACEIDFSSSFVIKDLDMLEDSARDRLHSTWLKGWTLSSGRPSLEGQSRPLSVSILFVFFYRKAWEMHQGSFMWEPIVCTTCLAWACANSSPEAESSEVAYASFLNTVEAWPALAGAAECGYEYVGGSTNTWKIVSLMPC